MAIAVVSGASGGIGSVIVQRLLAEGYQVLGLCYRHIPSIPLTQTAALRYQAIDLAVARPPRLNLPDARYDLLVIAHGASPNVKPTLEVTEADWDLVFNTDVKGALWLCQVIAPCMMRQRQGCIVLLSSFHAHATYPQRTVYAAAKSAVCSLARSLAVEWGPYGIRTNAVTPGQVEGPRTEGFLRRARETTGEDLRAQMCRRSPAGRLVAPEDVADTVLWLARTPSVNGTTITLDHGWGASAWYKPYGD